MINLKVSHFLIALFLTVCAASCNNNDVFTQFKTLPEEGWHKDSLAVFDVPITDISANYNIYVNIRNNNRYPYQNFWFFKTQITPDGTIVNDTIECYLADNRGKWLGSGIGAVYEMSVLCEQNVRFEKEGIYQYKITQGMREDVLRGIQDIGLQVEKVSGKLQVEN